MEELEVDLLLHQALDERDVVGVRGGGGRRRRHVATTGDAAVEARDGFVGELVDEDVREGEHLGDGVVEAAPLQPYPESYDFHGF